MFQDGIYSIWILIQIIIGYHLISPLLLSILHALKTKPKFSLINPKNETDYAVIVTAYEQTDSLPAAIHSLLQISYTNYLIYVVADKCDISGLNFDNSRVIILQPKETLASNVRSHFYAINNFKRQHERLTIIDSDNLVHPDYLNELNHFFEAGFKAVQGIRRAKNLNSTYACLDATRDIYYHFYDGKILFELGSSATLAGSGMAFTTALYRDCLEHKEVTGAGFDKVLQAEILKRDLRIAFAPTAIVFDEKTTKSDQLVHQRSRWINTWFKYFSYGFSLATKGIKNLSWNQLLFGLTLLRPPLFIFLLLSAFCMLINLLIAPIIASIIWAGAFVCFITGFGIALASSKTDKRILKSLLSIPKFIFYQVISLINIRKANKRSVATQHFHRASIEEMINK